MNKKILFVYSLKTQIELPKELFQEYQLKSITVDSQIFKTIEEYKPQIIIFDENVKQKLIKKTVERFKFIPVCVVGKFEKPEIMEKFLQLGVTVLSLTSPEIDFISTINNLLFFSLSKEELWDEEYKLSTKELLWSKITFVAKFVISVVVLLATVLFLPKLYALFVKTKPIFYEVDCKYITPSDISLIEDKYILNDWTIKNIFEYKQTNNELIKVYFPEEQFHTVSINSKGQVVAYSMLNNKFYVYKYPEFSVSISTFVLKKEITVLSICIDNDNNLYVLDNRGSLNIFSIENLHKPVFISSITISEFFPIDVCVYEDNIVLLDSENNLYKINKTNNQVVSKIILNKFFDLQQIKFSSFVIGKEWIFIVSEKTKKVVKLPVSIIS